MGTIRLDLDASEILLEPQHECPEGSSELKKEGWGVRSKALFKVILASLKPDIKQATRRVITEANKDAAEVWTVLENGFGLYHAVTRETYYNQFTTINIGQYKKDVLKYITALRKVKKNLQAFGYPIPSWAAYPFYCETE